MSTKTRLSFALLLFCLFLSSLLIRQVDQEEEAEIYNQPPPDTDLPISSDPIISLSHLAALSPPVPPSVSCLPPGPLPQPTSCGPERHTGLTGELLSQPRSLVLMLMFGFEVDTLEIALREQLDYLDMIVIVESTVNQKGRSKPLLWERLKFSDRFSFVNQSKVSHVVVDEGVLNPEMVKTDRWYQEYAQTDLGIEWIRNWAKTTGGLRDNDLLLSGDVDEILYPSTLNLLRWCELSGPVIAAGVWMPQGNLDKAFLSYFPVGNPGLPHTWRSPTIYKWAGVANGSQNGRRDFISVEVISKYVLGGIHMSGNSYLPTAILKHISGTDQNRQYDSFFNIYENVTLADLDQQQAALYKWEYIQYGVVTFGIRDEDFDPASKVTDIRTVIPWFLACNRARFPYWFGEADPRNQNFLQALNSGSSPLTFDQRKKLVPYLPDNLPNESKKHLLRLFFTPADKDGNILYNT